MNQKYFILAATAIVLLAILFFGFNTSSPHPEASENLQVTTSFYPLYFFAEQIGGDKADVVNITPAGAEPHDYEPTAQQIARIQTSNLLILNGGGLESWSNKVQKNIDPSKTAVLTVGENLITKETTEDGENMKDPHIWLSPQLAKEMVATIAHSFATADPINADYYAKNAKALEEQLAALDTEYKTGLSHCTQQAIVTSHAAFAYLASSYNLHQVAIGGLSPDAEPSLTQLTDIVTFVKNNNVRVIFFESLVSPKLAQTIAKETGAQTMVLDPIEGLSDDDIAAGKTYFTQMEQNLTNLKAALQCM